MKMAPKAVVGRVSLYLRQLEAYQRQGYATVSSSQLGEPLSIKNAQVRKDLAFFGQFGHPGIGYRIEELIDALRHILGIDHEWPLALVGMGNLGRALLRYRGFRTRGFHVVALFDNDPAQDRPEARRHGGRADRVAAEGGRSAQDQAGAFVRSRRCRPARGRYAGRERDPTEFSISRPCTLTVPPHVNVVAVDLSIQLENLAYKVQKTQGEVSCARLDSLFACPAEPIEYIHPYPVVKRYHNRFWSCFSRFEILAG